MLSQNVVSYGGPEALALQVMTIDCYRASYQPPSPSCATGGLGDGQVAPGLMPSEGDGVEELMQRLQRRQQQVVDLQQQVVALQDQLRQQGQQADAEKQASMCVCSVGGGSRALFVVCCARC